MAVRNFSSTAVGTTLTSSVTNVATTVNVAATTGFPAAPFIARIDADTASEELVLVTNVAGLVLTVTRGYDSTSAQAHASGASFRHAVAAIDLREANAHVNASAAVHGLTGSVVGTSDTQTLTNKTISGASNTLSAIPSSAVTGLDTHTAATAAHGATGAVVGTTNTQTLTNKTLTTPVINGSGGTLSLPAGPDTLVGRATTDTLTNKTLTSPTLNSPTINTPSIVNGGAITLPSGVHTLVGRSTTDTLTNKSISGATNVLSSIPNSATTATLAATADAIVTRGPIGEINATTVNSTELVASNNSTQLITVNDTTTRTLTASTSTFTALAGGASGTFVAPSSGRMMMSMSGYLTSDTSTSRISLVIRTGGTIGAGSVVVGSATPGFTLSVSGASGSALQAGTTRMLVGLTAGATYNFRVEFTNTNTANQSLFTHHVQLVPMP